MEEEPPFLLLLPKAVESLLVSQHNTSVLVFVNRLRRGRSCTLEDGMVVDILIDCLACCSCFLLLLITIGRGVRDDDDVECEKQTHV